MGLIYSEDRELLKETPTKSQLLADMTTHPGYKILIEDVFERLIELEVDNLFNVVKGPQARIVQLEAVTYMKAYLKKAKDKIAQTLIDAQQQQMKGKRDVPEIQRPGRRR